jgi:hypothetical protein
MGQTPIPNPHYKRKTAVERRVARLERRVYGTPASLGTSWIVGIVAVCVIIWLVAR